MMKAEIIYTPSDGTEDQFRLHKWIEHVEDTDLLGAKDNNCFSELSLVLEEKGLSEDKANIASKQIERLKQPMPNSISPGHRCCLVIIRIHVLHRVRCENAGAYFLLCCMDMIWTRRTKMLMKSSSRLMLSFTVSLGLRPRCAMRAWLRIFWTS